MNKLKLFFLSFSALLFTLSASAQGGIKKAEDSTDFMRSNGKINVVVAVIIVILIGLFLYLYNLDKKITSLEKRNQP